MQLMKFIYGLITVGLLLVSQIGVAAPISTVSTAHLPIVIGAPAQVDLPDADTDMDDAESTYITGENGYIAV